MRFLKYAPSASNCGLAELYGFPYSLGNPEEMHRQGYGSVDSITNDLLPSYRRDVDEAKAVVKGMLIASLNHVQVNTGTEKWLMEQGFIPIAEAHNNSSSNEIRLYVWHKAPVREGKIRSDHAIPKKG